LMRMADLLSKFMHFRPFEGAGENAGAGAGLLTPPRAFRFPRAALCECRDAVDQPAGAGRARASVAAIQSPAKTAATPSTRLAPNGSSSSRAAKVPAASGFTVIVAVTRVGVARWRAQIHSQNAAA